VQEKSIVESKTESQKAFWSEVERMSVASEAAKDGHTGIHYQILAKAAGKCDVVVTMLSDASGDRHFMLHVEFSEYTCENGIAEFLTAFCGFKEFARCPLTKKGCFFKKLDESVANNADSVVKTTLDAVQALHECFAEAKQVWRGVLRQAKNGFGVDVPFWEELLGRK
jgi:hypothetical protein